MYQPLIVSACFAPDSQALLDGLRSRYFPPERNHLSAHLTLFHALPGGRAAEVAQALSRAVQAPAPVARLTRLMPLGRGFAVAVQAPELRAIHDAMQRSFADCLTAQDAQPLRPHVTLQNKVSPHVAKAELARAEKDFVPLETKIVLLRLWRYEGGPWHLLDTFAFLTPPEAMPPTR